MEILVLFNFPYNMKMNGNQMTLFGELKDKDTVLCEILTA